MATTSCLAAHLHDRPGCYGTISAPLGEMGSGHGAEETVDEVIVHDANRLHECVDDRRIWHMRLPEKCYAVVMIDPPEKNF
jgi:hypothetical protein